MKTLRTLVIKTYKGFYEVRGPTMASSIAFFTLMTIAPFGVLTLWVGGLIIGQAQARATISQSFQRLLGPSLGAQMVQLVGSESHKSVGQLAGILGVLLLLYGAGSLFLAVQHALDEVWRVRIAKSTDLRFHVAIRALVVFSVIFLPAALLAMLIVARGVLGALAPIAGSSATASLVYSVATQLLYVLGAWALVALILVALPDATLGWRSIALGSGVTAVGWSVGTWAFGLYFSFTTASRYQLAGSFVALLIWVFLMAQLLLIGARLAYEHGCLTGGPAAPRPWAELYESVAQ